MPYPTYTVTQTDKMENNHTTDETVDQFMKCKTWPSQYLCILKNGSRILYRSCK